MVLAHSPCAVSGKPTGEQLCLGGWGGGSPVAVTLPSPPLPGLSPGQQSETPT